MKKTILLLLFIFTLSSFAPSKDFGGDIDVDTYIDPMACAEKAFNVHKIFTDAGFERSWASYWADRAYDSCMTLFE